MTTQPSDELLLIKLPVPGHGQPVDVLVRVRAITRGAEISIVICERDDAQTVRNFPGHSELPQRYESRSLGPMSAYMSRHADHVKALIECGAARLANLTLARAVHIMQSQGACAQDAIAAAEQIDEGVLSMHRKQAQAVSTALA